MDLVYLVKETKSRFYKIGKDLGIISFNDSPLKEIVADGITTISTDFAAMGKVLARMILKSEKN